MILQSHSYSFDLSHPLCPCQKSIKAQNFSGFVLSRRKRKRFLSTTGQTNFRRRCSFRLCAFSSDGSHRNLNVDIATSATKGAKKIVFKRISNELEGGEVILDSNSQRGSNFTSFQEDPIVDKLRTQLGVIHPIPSPPINRNIVGLFVLFFFVGVVFDKVWTWRRTDKGGSDERRRGALPQLPSSFSLLLEKDLQRKESVEWVNMVLGKLWKGYRGGIENWIVGLLQPVIDDLKKPEYVQRVEIKQFSLGEEPLSVRNVERRTSRRINDLQYQIGLRYTGGARMLLMLSLRFGIIPIVVPVGIRDFDIDGELWVKLRLIPTEPWVGAASWAFVSLPKIKFELSPFRLFNLMAIPVLSMFLRKLLTEDLPRLFVRPKKIVLDFQKGKAVGPVSNDFKSGEAQERNKDFVGELSVTVVDAQKLPYLFFGKTDPYVILNLGDQIIRSKKNSQTTVFGPPGRPIWNQDFHMLVGNPKKQKLNIQVKDSLGFTDFTVGAGEVDLTSLKDTVPTDRIVVLRGSLGLLSGGYSGEILVRLTYKAYVEDEEDENAGIAVPDPDASDDETDTDEPNLMNKERVDNATDEADKESFMDVLAALIVSEEFQGIVASETGYNKTDDISTRGSTLSGLSPDPQVQTPSSSPNDAGITRGSALFWLAVITSISVLTALNIGGSSIFNP